MPDNAKNGAPGWERLAEKLADAGPTEDDARAWVREVLAQAWDEGYEHADNGRDEDGNPYRDAPTGGGL